MYDYCRSLQRLLGGINWPAILQGFTGIWMALIATLALSTWRRQLKANKRTEFIDTLTDTIHDFILSMSGAVSFLKFAINDIDCYARVDDKHGCKKRAAVAFIEERGKPTGEEIQKHLDVVRPILSKMLSLEAKGQILGIENYNKCHNSCRMLAWSYNQIEAFCCFIGTSSRNWENPLVQETLDKILSIDPEEITKNLEKQNCQFLSFAKQAYKTLK